MNIDGIYMICLRDLIRHFRDRVRVLGSLFRPVLWLLIFGSGLGSMMQRSLPDYRHFLFPGIIVMNLVFAAMQSAISIVWDREFGFLKEILVAPISRTSIALGKALSGTTVALIEGIFVLILAPLIQVRLSLEAILLLLPTMFLVAFICTSIGILIASRMSSFEGFGLIANFVIMPMFFLSGALFPVKGLPHWLNILVRINPLTYGVDLLRKITLGEGNFPFILNISILGSFAFFILLLATVQFNRMD